MLETSYIHVINKCKIFIMQILKRIVPIIENFIIYNDCELLMN